MSCFGGRLYNRIRIPPLWGITDTRTVHDGTFVQKKGKILQLIINSSRYRRIAV